MLVLFVATSPALADGRAASERDVRASDRERTSHRAVERAHPDDHTAIQPGEAGTLGDFRTERPRPTQATEGRLLSRRKADRLIARVLARERNFYRDGISFDARTGMSFDGHPVDIRTGKAYALARSWSAASKESLHIILLAKAVAGDPIAQGLLTPDPKHPELAVGAALEVLRAKIATYERFNKEYPGFGGFLPWYQVRDGRIVPTGDPASDHPENAGTGGDWTYRVPGLDNGQLTWSMYLAENVLREHGNGELADAYGAHLALMRENVVRIFYDPEAKQLRAEAKLDRGNQVAPAANRYSNNQKDYLLNDAYEGLMLVHFADLFGDWKGHEEGKDALWREARRVPTSYEVGTKRVTVVEGNWFSGHESWGDWVLPNLDLPVAKRLYDNAQRVRTDYARRNGFSGLFASTHRPVRKNTFELDYKSGAGIQEVAKEKVEEGEPVFALYAAATLAPTSKRLFATWLGSMLKHMGAFTELGIGESYTDDGKSSPVATWDGKALPIIAYMGGISSDIRRYLKRDGKYEGFFTRLKHDYRRFDENAIEGEDVPFSAPARVRRHQRGR